MDDTSIWEDLFTRAFLRDMLSVFGVVLAALVGARIARFYLDRGAQIARERNKGLAAVTMQALARSIVFPLFAVALRIVIGHAGRPGVLALPAGIQGWFDSGVSVFLVVAVAYVAYHLVDVVDWILGRGTARTESRMDDMLVPMVRKSLRITVVILALVQIAQVLSDKPVTSILAGLGVGGLAVALAAQDTLKNFFGSLVIFADKPFELGDRVLVDGHDGPVEEVGFRSTRIRTLEGHLVTIPNGELANKTIQNIGKRRYIRRLTNISITYDTPPDKVVRAIEIVREILDNHEGMRPDFPPRVFFSDFNDYSLNLLVIYWYHPPDYWRFQAFNELVNMQILRRFNDEGIEFAFPTQTAYLAGDPNRPLKVMADIQH